MRRSAARLAIAISAATSVIACEPSGTERSPAIAPATVETPVAISDGEISVELPASAGACMRYPSALFQIANCPPDAKALESAPVVPDGAFLALATLPGAPAAIGWSVARQRSNLTSAFTPATADSFVRGFVTAERRENPAVRVMNLSVTIVPVHGFTVLRFSMDLEGVDKLQLDHLVRYIALARGWIYTVSLKSPRAQAATLDDLAGRVASTISLKNPAPPGPGDPEQPPRALAPLGAPSNPDGGASVAISDADLVIATLRPKFKACYQAGLNQDPTLTGKAVVLTRIAPDGAADSATVPTPSTLSVPVDACLARAVRNAHFAAPGGTGSTLKIPITFKLQGQDDDGGAPPHSP